jgi:hypothetical protein
LFESCYRLIDGHKFLGIVLIQRHGRADFLLATLAADHPDQVGTAELQIVFLAKLEEVLQVNTRHTSPLVTTAFK